MLTRVLFSAIAILVLAGAWRLARWHWRPRLRLPEDAVLTGGPDGLRLSLEVRNEGAGRSHGCRARLLRAERAERGGWLRVETPAAGSAETAARSAGIPAHGSTILEVDRLLPPEPGRYRVEVAVMNGEEVRASYVVRVEGSDTSQPPEGPRDRSGR